MAVKLDKTAFGYAKELVDEEKFVWDERGAWSEHQPYTQEENEFIRLHGIHEYARWHLGIDDEEDEQNKRRYKFPYGDFEKVHRCGAITAESRAGQYKYHDMELSAAHLHGMIDEKKTALRRRHAKAG